MQVMLWKETAHEAPPDESTLFGGGRGGGESSNSIPQNTQPHMS